MWQQPQPGVGFSQLVRDFQQRHDADAGLAVLAEELAEALDVLILDDVPRLSRADNNAAKRFVTLVDALYEAKVLLICSAAAEPDALYAEGEGAFEFQRTASRLAEMRAAGLTRRQILAVVAGEGAAWTGVGAVAGVLLGLAVSVVLVHVVNPQSFHWTMDLEVPLWRLLVLSLAVVASGTLTAWVAGRAAAGSDAVMAVKEDW